MILDNKLGIKDALMRVITMKATMYLQQKI